MFQFRLHTLLLMTAAIAVLTAEFLVLCPVQSEFDWKPSPPQPAIAFAPFDEFDVKECIVVAGRIPQVADITVDNRRRVTVDFVFVAAVQTIAGSGLWWWIKRRRDPSFARGSAAG